MKSSRSIWAYFRNGPNAAASIAPTLIQPQPLVFKNIVWCIYETNKLLQRQRKFEITFEKSTTEFKPSLK